MVRREQVQDFLLASMADIFMKEESDLRAHPEMRFREDLLARSMQYYPLINRLETEYDLAIDLPDFQNECFSIEATVDYLMSLFQQQHP